MRVLVVEDSDTTRALLVGVLRDLGHEAEGASDARQAVSLLPHYRPDALVLDYLLPDASGRVVLQRLRERRAWAGLPVLVLTAASPEETEGLEAYAPVRVMRKGAAPEDIAGALAELTKGG